MQASNGRTFGIEIEMSEFYHPKNGSHRDDVSDSYDGWIGKGDGSLRGNHTAEVESPILRGEVGCEEVLNLFDEFKSNRIITEANESCGLHVHVGLDDYEVRDLINLWRLTTNIEALLFAMQHESRWNNQYCTRTRGNPWFATDEMSYAACIQGQQNTIRNAMNQISGNSYFQHGPTRYYGFNMLDHCRRKCVEFRLHHGSVDGEEIVNWCRFLVTLCDFVKSYEGWIPCLNSPSRRGYALRRQLQYLRSFISEAGATDGEADDIIEYCQGRLVKYNGDGLDVTEQTGDLKFVDMSDECPWSSTKDLSGGGIDYLSMHNFSTFVYENVLYCGRSNTVHEKVREIINAGLMEKIRESGAEVISEWESAIPAGAITEQVSDGTVREGALVVMSQPNVYEEGTFQYGLGVVVFVTDGASVVEFMTSSESVIVNNESLRVLRDPLNDGEYFMNRDGERSNITAVEESFNLYRAMA